MRFWPWLNPPKPAQVDDSYRRYDAYSKLLDRNGRWVEVADTKAAVILGFLIATFPALMAPAFPAVRKLAMAIPPRSDVWAYLPVVAFIALLGSFTGAALITLLRVLLVLTPRLTRQRKPGLVYFGDVAALKWMEWQQRMLAADPETLALEVLEQVYTTAYIADRKHNYVRSAINALFVTVVLGLMLYVLSQVVT